MVRTINSRQVKHFNNYDGQQSVQPIKDEEILNNFLYNLINKYDHAKSGVKQYQAYRNYMLCFIGFNTAFRAEDLLQLRVKDVDKGYMHIKENKTGKPMNFRMNATVWNPIKKYINDNELEFYDYLFLGQITIRDGKPYKMPITRKHAYKIIRKNANEVGIDFPFGLHSLRKTFGYMYIKNTAGKQETLRKMYNHSTYAVTQRYICWGREDAEKDRLGIAIGTAAKFVKKT
jgi:integrase